jgi:hypothetical protein
MVFAIATSTAWMQRGRSGDGQDQPRHMQSSLLEPNVAPACLIVVQPCSVAALLLRLMRIVHLDTVMGSDVAVASRRELCASHRILVMRFVGYGDATPCRGPQSGSVALRKTKTGQQRFEPMSHHVFADAWQYVVMAFAGLLR